MNLVVSQVNGCRSCVAAHTVIGKLNGLTDDQIIELRGGHAPFDTRLDALARFVQRVAESRGRPSAEAVSDLVAAGFTKANIVASA